MKKCRDCGREVSEQAIACPSCGAPYPAREKWDGWGFEYRSAATFLGVPLLHISFKYRPGGRPVVARGIVAIGQFGVGVFTLSQCGIGLIGIGQFTVAGVALAQFGIAYSLVAQFGLYLSVGHGQRVLNLLDVLRQLLSV